MLSILSTIPLLALPLTSSHPIPIPQANPTPGSFSLIPSAVITSTLPPLGSSRGRTGSLSSTSLQYLQLNLCNSGFANCYAGGLSIPEGADLIYATAPNVVTVNEICSSNVVELQGQLREAWPDDWTYSVFMSAENEATAQRYKCKDSDAFYGSAILGRVEKGAWSGVKGYGGQYTRQDSTNEGRIFACADVKGDMLACATHLAAKPAADVALAQGKALMFDVIPYLRTLTAATGKTIVGGDFNLKYGEEVNVQDCVPNGFTRKGDGDVQHVIFSNALTFEDTKKYGLSYTDHDGFLVKLKTG